MTSSIQKTSSRLRPRLNLQADIGWYDAKNRWAYLIYEVTHDGKRLCVVSPAKYTDWSLAHLHAMKEVENIRRAFVLYHARMELKNNSTQRAGT